MSLKSKQVGDTITYRSCINYIGLNGNGKPMYNGMHTCDKFTGIILEKKSTGVYVKNSRGIKEFIVKSRII